MQFGFVRGRPRQFNEREVLEKAANLFRERGYVGTSMSALSRAMGMGEQSIYNVFGNKEGLFQAALSHYCQATDGIWAALDDPDADARATIEAFFAAMVTRLAAGNRPCLVTQSCLGTAADNADVARILEERMRKSERMFQRAIEVGIAQGNIACAEPAGLARFLNLALQGLNVVARTATEEQLRDLTRQALSQLGPRPAPSGQNHKQSVASG